jgi:choline dehydrogenase-like flavoprotein
MTVDGLSLEDGAAVGCDICIVGAGAAGITLACELDGSGLDVVLLEAGGSKYSAALQEELRGEVAEGSVHCPPNMYRRKILGGATTIWGGRCVPLSPIDLGYRNHVPHSGWPIFWQELERYYPESQVYCESGHYSYRADDALGDAAGPTIEGFADPDIEDHQIERFSPPTDFGKVYRKRLAMSGNVRLVLGAKVVRVHEAGATVAMLDAEFKSGRRFIVRARHYVLATGGLEIPRLLMASDETRRGGIGNEGGALGRFYMCHIENTLGLLRLNPPTRPVKFDFGRTSDGIYVRNKFTISPEAQKRERLLNTTARLHYPMIADPAHRNGVLSAMYIAKDLIIPEYRRKLATIEIANRDRLTRNSRFWAAHLANIGLDGLGVARFGVDWLRRRIIARRKLPFVVFRSRDGSYPLDINAEQIPDPANTVTLAHSRGTDGIRQIRINWRLTEQDIDSLHRTMLLMRAALARSGCGTLEFDTAQLTDQIRSSTPVGGHHIGTARMADNPAQGVVDQHCKVHGMDNLHLAGSAVFPTCGHANPTLTIVALSIRLAKRLRFLTQEKPAVAHFSEIQAV